MTTATEKQESTKAMAPTIEGLLKNVNIKSRFEEMLGRKAAGFMSSIISVTNQSKMLKTADPTTILSAAAVAASLDLPINPSLGFAHIVPYKDNKKGMTIAQFQMGWKGFIQLAQRSGKYETINVAIVYDGELVKYDRFTGRMEFDSTKRSSDKITGYVAYFKLLNGFEKYYYMTKDEAARHGRRYSKSYETGQWTKDFDVMAMKTVVKMLLSKFGILSIEMQKAVELDQAMINEDGSPEYIDGTSHDDIDIEALPEPSKVESLTDKIKGKKKDNIPTTIQCPNTDSEIDRIECDICKVREGCPAHTNEDDPREDR